MSVAAILARARFASASSSALSLASSSRHALPVRQLAAATALAPSRAYAKPAKKGGKPSKPSKGPAADHDGDGDGDGPAPKKHGGAGKAVATDALVPASQLLTADAEYRGTEGKMLAAAEWLRKEVAALETRATGRVTPGLLAPVRVRAQGAKDARGVRLEEVATVGVKDGTVLIVTVFEEHTLKAVEAAIYEAKIPSITPQRVDSRTLKIPVPKPTVEARKALYTDAARHAEDSRGQIRKLTQALMKKKNNPKKGTAEFNAYQALNDRFMGEIDKILAHLKKSTG
ncbi:ribosome recycling factor [Epithele typhae]|uniref:ribosome recycling factor n=1 Tax=Epithele typhae TaxID=378194 RepID=UPI0020080E63|nr:ribosome recycling factor [Epithele typhae]KAH9941232.1 ribosome recycling factor [Epithele typhae]